MRIRSTKPEFWRSERVASVSWDARFVLKGLEHYVDDNGVGKDDVALIVGDVFPRDMLASPRETVARVSEAISELHKAGLVHRYEAAGTRLLCVGFWEQSQRIDKPGKGRFPRPDGTMDYRESEIRASLASPPEVLAPGTGEQGNRGTDELLSNAPRRTPSPVSKPDTEFEAFWSIYPRREAKKNAIKAWAKARKEKPAAAIILGAKRYAEDPNREQAFTKLPATWLNSGGWDDEPLPPRNVTHLDDRRAAPDVSPEIADDMRRNPHKYR